MVAPSNEQLRLLNRWRFSTVMVMIIGYIGYYMCRGNLSAALPLLSDTFKYSNTELAVILTVSELVYALGKFLTGPLADKIGGRKIFLTGMAGAIVFNLLFVQFSSILMFTVIWSIVRFFLSMGWGGIIKVVGSWFEPERNGTIMGLVSINFQLGGGIAFMFCSYLLYLGFGWKALFVIPAFAVTIIWVWSFFSFRDSPQEIVPNVDYAQSKFGRTDLAGFGDRADKKIPVREIITTLLAQPMFRWLLVFSFLTTFVRSNFILWTAKFLADIGMENTSAVLKAALFPFLGVVGTVLLGWYTDRYSKGGNRTPAMSWMLLGLTFCLLVIALLVPYRMEYQNWIVFLTGASGFFLMGPYSLPSGCLTLDIAGPKGGGTATGLLDGVGYMGGSLATLMTGAIADLFGWAHVYYFMSCFGVLTVLCTLRMNALYHKKKEVKMKLVNAEG
ncbi:MAG: MFS transporter [Deltaproteobacteria bacterium]|nr:MFS transporter [Deltaproteobacteria bacterium]